MSDHSQQNSSLLSRFTVLAGAPRELWIVFAVHLVGYISYAVMNWTFVLWLSYDLGYSDANAGYWVAGWSALMTLITVFVGSLTDAIGVRKALLLSFIVCVVTRFVMTFAEAKWLALGLGMIPVALGEALGTPAMVAGTRRYSSTAQRSISFSLFYASMNVGILISTFIFDYVRRELGEPVGHFTIPVIGVELTTYRTLFLVSFIFQCALFPLLYFMREGVEATDEGIQIKPEEHKYPNETFLRALWLSLRDALRETVRIFAGLWRQPGFHKFLGFLTLAAFVRLIFVHMNYTYPKFGIRELGAGASIGSLYAINAFLIIFLVPLVGAISAKIPAYRMVTIGSVIAAASVFIMTIPTSAFQSTADGWFGHLIANKWLGGYSRFTADDFINPHALAGKIESGSCDVSAFLKTSVTETTRSLLRRELQNGYRNPGPGPRPSSALFEAGDIKDPDAFASRLQHDADTATQSVSALVWNRFSEKGKQQLTDTSCPASTRQATLLKEMNRVLQGESLCGKQKEPPPGTTLSEETVGLLKQDPKKDEATLPNLLLLQNRLVLEDIYPQQIARSPHPLRASLAQDLTNIIQNDPMNEKTASTAATQSTRPQQQQPSPSKERNLAHRNRLLLEDAFPLEIARNRVGVQGSVNPYYVMIFIFVIVLSFGEAIYSPRLYEYAAAIAPKGQEGSYMSLSYLPFFLAKLSVATFSGVLLANYCPESGPRSSGTLWMIIALTTSICPVGLITLRRWIRVREAGREE